MDSWQHLEATAAERLWFPDLDAALATPSRPAAPPNRWREVRRLEAGHGTYFLKVFHRTQLKNRLRSRLTAPCADLDGERESRVGAALRARGIATARPVALGRRGAASYYLCAGLPGRSLREALAAGELDRTTADAAARFAGSIAARGVVLPDLSADHVWLTDERARQLAVLDLHNGRLAAHATARDSRRMLRRFRKSVDGLAVPPRAALRFALLLLGGMGQRRQARALLADLPPLDTHSRYETAGKSAAYRDRNPARHRRELTCLRAVWPGRSGDRVLDVPCGTGRVSAILHGELDATVVGADRAAAMLRESRHRDPGARLVQCDATRLPFADRSADGVVCFRFLHHLDPEQARRLLAETTRVARGWVVVSFFHPLSAHALQRALAALLGRRPRTRHTVSRRRLRRWMAEFGFSPTAWSAHLPYLRDFWLAAFHRR